MTVQDDLVTPPVIDEPGVVGLDNPLPTPRRAFRRARPAESRRGIVSARDLDRCSTRYVWRAIQIVVLIGLLVSGFGPLVWLAKAAVSTANDSNTHPFGFWSHGIQLHNLSDAWTQVRITDYLWNTVVLCVGCWIASLIVCTTLGYALSVLRPVWGPVVSGAVMATLFVPAIIALVPLYLTILHVPGLGTDLQNQYWAVWLPGAANAFNVLITSRFFDSIPRELIEAAQIDGAGPVRIFVSLVLPLSRPILGVVSLLAITGSYKDYLWPLLVLPDPSVQPLSVALPKIEGTADGGVFLAAMFISVIIPVVLFLVFQRQILRGVGLSGAIKG